MPNYKTGTWFAVGRWIRGKWHAYDVCHSERVARHNRLRRADIRRVNLKYLD